MNEALKAFIEARLSELEMNPFEAARKGELERSYINDILIGKKNSIRDDKKEQVAKALEVSTSDLYLHGGGNGAGEDPVVDSPRIGQKIRELRQSKNWSVDDLARHAGLPARVVVARERDTLRTSRNILPEIARALGVPVSEIDPTYRAGVVAPLPKFFTPDLRMPVYAAAEGGEGHMIVSTDVIERVPLPYTLEGVSGAYGILVVGESMMKAFRPGDVAWVNPLLPPMRDTDVILYEVREETGDAKASIKSLVGYTDKEWHVEQYNPPKKFSLGRASWVTCHRVVGKFSRR